MSVILRFSNSHLVAVPLGIFISIFSAILHGWKAIWKPTDCKFAESFMALSFSWGVNWTGEGSWRWRFRLCASCFVNDSKFPGIAATYMLFPFLIVKQQSQREWSEQFIILLTNETRCVLWFNRNLFSGFVRLYSLKDTSGRKLQTSKSLTSLKTLWHIGSYTCKVRQAGVREYVRTSKTARLTRCNFVKRMTINISFPSLIHLVFWKQM